MVLEVLIIAALMLLVAHFIFGVNVHGLISFIVLILILGAFLVFTGVCVKFGWNLL